MAARTEAWIGAGAAVVVAALVVAGAVLVPPPPGPMAAPRAGELAALSPYLDPAAAEGGSQAGVPATVVIEGSPFGPVAAPAGPDGPPPRARPASPWTVTAIMIAGARRIAIVNDRLVRPGDRLEDGTRIEAVERDHVVLITPDGERRRLELER